MGHDGERPRLSWREIDQKRDGTSGKSERGQRPLNRAQEARAQQATDQYVKGLDKMFTSEQGGAEGEDLATSVRDAHGTPELVEACKAYRAQLGMPNDVGLLSIFLDANETDLVAAALEHMIVLQAAGKLSVTSGLKAQLRVHAQAFEDAVAGAAEDLLAAL